MSSPAFAILFGLTCAPPCTLTGPERESIERETIRVLVEHGFSVMPAPDASERPTAPARSINLIDEAGEHSVERVVVLDLEPKERGLWVTQFVRGFAGPWAVGQVVCARDESKALRCPELERVVLSGLRPRTRADIDLVSLLRKNSVRVEACVAAEDDVPIDERTFGRVEMDLEALPKGNVHMISIVPAVVSRKSLGRCLRSAMESMNVGAFEGEPIRFRIPVDLD